MQTGNSENSVSEIFSRKTVFCKLLRPLFPVKRWHNILHPTEATSSRSFPQNIFQKADFCIARLQGNLFQATRFRDNISETPFSEVTIYIMRSSFSKFLSFIFRKLFSDEKIPRQHDTESSQSASFQVFSQSLFNQTSTLHEDG